jgi:signal transduction histidine kinase
LNRTSPAPGSRPWIFYLVTGLLSGSAFLRSLLSYRGSYILGQALILLLAWLILLALSESVLPRGEKRIFSLYLLLQCALIFTLTYHPDETGFDFYAALYLVHAMQLAQRYSLRATAAWLGFVAVLITWALIASYGAAGGAAYALIYNAFSFFLAAYMRADLRAQAAREQNESLAHELQAANAQLDAYTNRLERLAAARERNRLARDLHDSVTQTMFSMNLTAQSALLLLEHEPGRAGGQLERLNQLAQGALSEIQVLVSELRPQPSGLAEALRDQIAGRFTGQGLSVTLEVEGDAPLSEMEEQNLLRIALEALNNTVKHARARRAAVRLHWDAPLWIEIEDDGQGFDPVQPRDSSRVGLSSMRGRAEEIGWDLQITSSPGAGTRVRVEKGSQEAGK